MLLPEKTPYVSSEVSLFGKLVSAGENKSHVTLPFQLRGFLIECLKEHLYDTDILTHLLCVDLYDPMMSTGKRGRVVLKRVGDEALLLAGLYPEGALRLRLSASYFRFMGQAAYASLAAHLVSTGMREPGKFFDHVAENFGSLEKVLNAARVEPDMPWDAFRRLYARLQE